MHKNFMKCPSYRYAASCGVGSLSYMLIRIKEMLKKIVIFINVQQPILIMLYTYQNRLVF